MSSGLDRVTSERFLNREVPVVEPTRFGDERALASLCPPPEGWAVPLDAGWTWRAGKRRPARVVRGGANPVAPPCEHQREAVL